MSRPQEDADVLLAAVLFNQAWTKTPLCSQAACREMLGAAHSLFLPPAKQTQAPNVQERLIKESR